MWNTLVGEFCEKLCLKNWLQELGGKNGLKEWTKKVVDNGV